MKTSDPGEKKQLKHNAATLDKYLLMNEQEKDHEIQQAVARLQNRIQKILYLLDTDKPFIAGSEAEPHKK